MKPYAILHPYVTRARILPDFTLPDGTVIAAPRDRATIQYHAPSWDGPGPIRTVTRQMIGVQIILHAPSPAQVKRSFLSLGFALGEAFHKELGRSMNENELHRLELSRGWLL